MPAVLLLAGLLVHLTLDDWYRHTVHRDSLPERRERQYAALGGEVDTLILGDSHALTGVEPGVLGDAFGLAIPGQFPPLVHAVLAAKLAAPDSGIDRVVLQADLHTFWPHLENWAPLRFYASLTGFHELGWELGEPLRFAVMGWLGRFAPYVGERSMIVGHLANGRPPELEWMQDRPLDRGAILTDWRWTDMAPQERVRVAAERADLTFRFGKQVDERAVAWFVRSLELARSRGVGVVVVQYPVTREYLAAAASWIDVAALDRRLGELLAGHPEVRRVEARNLFAGRPDLFADPDHINRHGARKLSRQIRRELDALAAAGS